MNSFLQSRISQGEITNLEIPVVFFKNIYMCSSPIFFLEQPNLQRRNQLLMKCLSVCRAGPSFFASSLCHDLFIQTFPRFPYQKLMMLCMSYMYPGQVATTSMTANVKCIVTWLYVAKKRKEIFIALFMDGVQLPPRLKAFRGDSLLFITKFPEIPGTHFNNLGRLS